MTSNVLTPSMVALCKEYPLLWAEPEKNYFLMSIDPSLGKGDDCSIVVAELGFMRDGRYGLDFHNGQYSSERQEG